MKRQGGKNRGDECMYESVYVHTWMCMLARVCSCVFVLDCGFIYVCVSCGLVAHSGVCTLNGWGDCWPLLSIKGSIDWKHESLSAASHPWTADNRPGHGGHSWKQSTTTGGKCFTACVMCLKSDLTNGNSQLCSWSITCKQIYCALKLF